MCVTTRYRDVKKSLNELHDGYNWLFLRQDVREDVRVVNLSITHDYLVPSLSFNVSRSSGNSNSNLASATSNFDFVLLGIPV